MRVWASPWVAIAVVLVTAVGALGVGATDVRVTELLRCLTSDGAPSVEAVLSLRWPRVVLGTLVGATLATSGAALQGLLRNTLADPGLVGVSTGAALAAAIAIVLARGAETVWFLPAAAFAGSFVTALLVLRVATIGGALPVASLILAGVAANAFAGAAIGALTFVANDAQLRALSSWNLGSLGAVTRPMVWAASPWLIAATGYLLLRADVLDALTLGDEAAAHLGVAVRRERLALVIATALGVGAATAFVGVLGFIGLVVPHLARGLAGPSHRVYMPVAASLGAVMVVVGDGLARTMMAPAEVPIGLVTAAFGAPALVLLLRTRSRELPCMIVARALHITREGRSVLRGVSVEARGGRLLAVLGPNGAGKSTLLRLLAGDRSPTSGTVALDDVALHAWDPRALARRRAVMLQDPPAAWPFTAAEFARLGRLPHGDQRLPSADVAVARSLAAVGASAFAARSMSRLSGGERRRVQAARALTQIDGVDDALLLLDEPVANLDPAAQHRLLAAMRVRARQGAAVVAVLHDVSLALAYADDAILLFDGSVVAAGPCSDALTPASLEEAFGVPFVLLEAPHSASRIAAAVAPVTTS